MVLLPPLQVGHLNFARDGKVWYCYVAIGLFAVSVLLLEMLLRSPLGAAIRAVRDDKNYAAARGISAARAQLLAIVLSAPLTGIAGGFYATYARVASTEVFGFGTLSLVLSMVLLGGAGTIYGPIVAAFVLTFVTEALVGLGIWRFLIISAGMILVLVALPGELASLIRFVPGFQKRA